MTFPNAFVFAKGHLNRFGISGGKIVQFTEKICAHKAHILNVVLLMSSGKIIPTAHIIMILNVSLSLEISYDLFDKRYLPRS